MNCTTDRLVGGGFGRHVPGSLLVPGGHGTAARLLAPVVSEKVGEVGGHQLQQLERVESFGEVEESDRSGSGLGPASLLSLVSNSDCRLLI